MTTTEQPHTKKKPNPILMVLALFGSLASFILVMMFCAWLMDHNPLWVLLAVPLLIPYLWMKPWEHEERIAEAAAKKAVELIKPK